MIKAYRFSTMSSFEDICTGAHGALSECVAFMNNTDCQAVLEKIGNAGLTNLQVQDAGFAGEGDIV